MVRSIIFVSRFSDLPTQSSSTGRTMQVSAQSVLSIPLTLTNVQMTLRPTHSNNQFQYCMEPINWNVVKKPLEVTEIHTTCRTNQSQLFRMCVAIRRDRYPPDVQQTIPGHTITLLAPLTITNLLPHELLYEISNESGRILPGSCADLHNINIYEQLEIIVQLDGYPGSGIVSCYFLSFYKPFIFIKQ